MKNPWQYTPFKGYMLFFISVYVDCFIGYWNQTYSAPMLIIISFGILWFWADWGKKY